MSSLSTSVLICTVMSGNVRLSFEQVLFPRVSELYSMVTGRDVMLTIIEALQREILVPMYPRNKLLCSPVPQN